MYAREEVVGRGERVVGKAYIREQRGLINKLAFWEYYPCTYIVSFNASQYSSKSTESAKFD